MKITNSEGTTHYASASETIAERASAGVRVDGMNVLEVYQATQAVERAKRSYINRM